MIVDQIGEIADGIFMLGHRAMPVFLVDGRRPALFDAGSAFMGPLYARQIRQILADRQPAWCFLTHSHFDHCGSVAYLKSQFPRMKVVCSKKAADVFGRPNAISLISELNQFAAGMAAEFGIQSDGIRFEPFDVAMTAGEGDRFEISPDTFVQVMETPGHTWDFLSYHIANRNLLVASEAMGTPDETGYLVTDCLVDYDVHYRSMQRLSALEVETLCLGHIYSCTGVDARRHMEDSLTHSRRFRNRVERYMVAEDGDVQAVMKRVKAFEWDGKPGLKQPEPAYLLNLQARINTILKTLPPIREPDGFGKPAEKFI